MLSCQGVIWFPFSHGCCRVQFLADRCVAAHRPPRAQPLSSDLSCCSLLVVIVWVWFEKGSYFITLADLELAILIPQLAKYWGYRCQEKHYLGHPGDPEDISHNYKLRTWRGSQCLWSCAIHCDQTQPSLGLKVWLAVSVISTLPTHFSSFKVERRWMENNGPVLSLWPKAL